MQLKARARGLAIAALMLAGTSLLPMQASAHYTGASWNYTIQPYGALHIAYSSDCAGGFAGVVDSAANAWYATPTPLYFNKVVCAWWYPSNNDVYTAALNSGALAVTYWWTYNSKFTYTDIYLNTDRNIYGSYTRFGALSAFNQQAVVVHEFGHVLGLAHAGYYNGEASGAYSVMDYCCYGYDTPRNHDISDINHLYPGWPYFP